MGGNTEAVAPRGRSGTSAARGGARASSSRSVRRSQEIPVPEEEDENDGALVRRSGKRPRVTPVGESSANPPVGVSGSSAPPAEVPQGASGVLDLGRLAEPRRAPVFVPDWGYTVDARPLLENQVAASVVREVCFPRDMEALAQVPLPELGEGMLACFYQGMLKGRLVLDRAQRLLEERRTEADRLTRLHADHKAELDAQIRRKDVRIQQQQEEINRLVGRLDRADAEAKEKDRLLEAELEKLKVSYEEKIDAARVETEKEVMVEAVRQMVDSWNEGFDAAIRAAEEHLDIDLQNLLRPKAAAVPETPEGEGTFDDVMGRSPLRGSVMPPAPEPLEALAEASIREVNPVTIETPAPPSPSFANPMANS